jgi:molybdopterin/thiamine biosynthesis adenylyltransferase
MNIMLSETSLLETGSILLVGAGGIGCEIVKNLIQSNTGSITIVDMDVIELTNLN